MKTRDQIVAELSAKLTRSAADSGNVVFLGFVSMVAVMFPRAAEDDALLDTLRVAYYNGAQHLFASIMSVMDSDREPTPGDMERMSKINDELYVFVKEMELRTARAGGTG